MDILDYTVICFYLIGLLFVGFLLRGQSSSKAYFLGGRELGWKPLTLSVMATQLSAVSFISAPAFVGFREGGGLIWLTYELAVPLAMLFLLGTVLPTLYRSGVVSIYDYLERRFGLSTRLIISVVFQCSRAFSTGIMVYALTIILQSTMGIEAWHAIALIGVVTLLYSLQGGMKAVVYGDAIQMVIIILGTIICAVVGLEALGGMSEFLQRVPAERTNAINFSSLGFNGDGFGFLPMIMGGIILYASYYGCDQSEAQRALSAKNETDLKKMMVANGLLRFPITLLYCLSGLIVGTLAFSDPSFLNQIPADNPDWLMPIFILNYLPHGIIGLLVVAILAAAMSSLSSAINSLAAVSGEDINRALNKGIEPRRYLFIAKVMGVVWGVIILILSLNAGNIAPTVIEAINKVGSVFFGPVLAVFLLGMLSKVLRGFDVNLGLLTGVFTNIVIAFFIHNIFWFWWNVIGFVTTIAMALLVSQLRSKGVSENDAHFKSIESTQDNRESKGSMAANTHSVLTPAVVTIMLSYFLLLVFVCWKMPDWFA
jgi:sodium-coupled monocarboxylate transporter 8/12